MIAPEKILLAIVKHSVIVRISFKTNALMKPTIYSILLMSMT